MVRADERSRIADLLITSDPSGVAGVCRRLQIPHFQAASSAPGCCALHRIALPVVSEWYQEPPIMQAPAIRNHGLRACGSLVLSERVGMGRACPQPVELAPDDTVRRAPSSRYPVPSSTSFMVP